MTTPAWLLLMWCGLASACAAGVVGACTGGTTVASWSLAPVPRSRVQGAVWSIVGGILVYPVAYGLIFEALHRADVHVGLLLGSIHGAAMFVLARRSTSTRAAFRVGLAHLAYAVALAFLYVTP